MNEKMIPKILIAIGLFLFVQILLYTRHSAEMSDNKMSLEAEVAMLSRKRDNLHIKVNDLEREIHRSQLKVDKLELQLSSFN